MNRVLNYICLISLGILILTGCKKDEFEPSTEGSPEFVSLISFDGQEIQLSAGVDNLVLETATSTIADTLIFQSFLSPSTCADCGSSLKMTLQGEGLASDWNNSNLEDVLPTWDFQLEMSTSTSEILSIMASSTGNSGDGFWFLNSEPLNEIPTSGISFIIEDEGDYELSLVASNPACGESASQNISFDGQTAPCIIGILQGSLLGFQVSSLYGIGPSAIYTWTLGDSTITTTSPNFLPNFQYDAEEICVQVEEQQGCSPFVCANIAPSPVSCVTNFIIDSANVQTASQPELISLFEIEFRDTDDILYSTAFGDQPNSSTVELLEVTPYTEPKSPNRDLVKAIFEIQCLVFDESGTAYPFSGTLQTAFEEPNP